MNTELAQEYKGLVKAMNKMCNTNHTVGQIMERALIKYKNQKWDSLRYAEWKRYNFSKIYTRDDGRCFWCHYKVSKNKATIDHLTPTSRGGKPLAANNMVICCSDCNASKGNLTGEEYILKLCTR